VRVGPAQRLTKSILLGFIEGQSLVVNLEEVRVYGLLSIELEQAH
jgi:hypothetical protein